MVVIMEERATEEQIQGVVAQWRATQHQVRESLESIGRVLSAAGAQYAETEAQAVRMFT